VNKNGVNWHLFNGATFSNVNDSVAIFDFSVTAGSFNVTGDGTFLDITNGFGGVVYCDDAGSTASFKFKRMWSDGCPVIVSAGTITLSGDIIESDSNIGAQGATRIGGAGAVVTILHTRVIANGSGATAHAITYSTGNTNLLLKDCTLQAGGNASAKAINGSGTAKISIEGTLAANAPISGVTMQNATNLTTIPGTLLLPGTNNVSFLRVTNSAVIPTNTAPFTIDVTDFVLDTNYTNGTQRAWVSAPILLSANAADTAQVALYLDQDADTAFEQTGNTASANGLVTNTVPLNAYLQPGAVFIFTNLSTGAATAAVNAGGSQWVKQ
jgi:hypothetical protein